MHIARGRQVLGLPSLREPLRSQGNPQVRGNLPHTLFLPTARGSDLTIFKLPSVFGLPPTRPRPWRAQDPLWTSASLKLDTKDIQAHGRTIEKLLQKLLNDHFDLLLKVRMVTTPIYELTLPGNDEKLMRSTISPMDCILDIGSDGCHSFVIGFGHPLNTRGADMSDLALYLENWTDLPVVDRTAITGLFAMYSEGWQPMNLPPPPPGASGTGTEFASLATLSAVLDGFGLQLHREEGKLPFYAVEPLDHPNAR